MTSPATRDWDDLAATDPLWAVLTDERYRADRLTPEAEASFWASGEDYVRHVSELFRRHFDRDLAPERALDFGCGVGRVLLPIARRARFATGVDASHRMLERARAAAGSAGLANVTVKGDVPRGELFDFVNSVLVFQHIPTRPGLALLRQLLGSLRPGGLLAIQVLYARPRAGAVRRAGRWLYARARTVRWLARPLRRGAGPGEPYMQMNAYPLDEVFLGLAEHGVTQVHAVGSSEGGFSSLLLVGVREDRKEPKAREVALAREADETRPAPGGRAAGR